MSKTKEDILFEACQIYNPLFADEQTKRFREETLKAMDTYAVQCVQEFKEKLKNEMRGRSVVRPQQVIELIDEL